MTVSMLTTRKLTTRVLGIIAALALVSGACSSQSQREPRADTAEKMEAAVATSVVTTTATSTATSLADSVESDSTDSSDSADSSESTESESAVSDSTEEKASETADASEVKYEYAIRSADNHIVKLATNKGDLILELYRDVAPNHADSFLARVKEGFYDGLLFHRVIPNFMIQGGDPTGSGSGDPDKPGYNLNAEFSDLSHQRGTLAMARRGGGGPEDPQGHNTASCQFFICNVPTPHLDGQYTIFGHLLSGYDALDAITATPARNSRPVEDMVITKATVVK